MPAKNSAVQIDDVTRSHRLRQQVVDELTVTSAGDEADVLAVRLPGIHEPPFLGDRADLRLREFAKGKAHEGELFACRVEQEIALVSRCVSASEQPASAIRQAPRRAIMPRRQRIGAEVSRGREEIGELDRAVAGRAGDRRLAPSITGGKRRDHGIAESRLVVQDVMRNAELGSNRARITDIATCAARPLAASGTAAVVELQRDADHVVAFVCQKRGDDGRIDTAGHGDDDTRVGGRLRNAKTVHASIHLRCRSSKVSCRRTFRSPSISADVRRGASLASSNGLPDVSMSDTNGLILRI